MSERGKSSGAQSEKTDKSQELVPSGREPVHQGQQFDEMQRQYKNPDGTPRDEEDES
jgi:hypothetical protein